MGLQALAILPQHSKLATRDNTIMSMITKSRHGRNKIEEFRENLMSLKKLKSKEW